MRLEFLDTPVSRSIKSGLDISAINHRLIADNIANADTPGYKALRLDFGSYYQEAKRMIDGTGTGMKMDPQSFIRRDDRTTMRLDGNNVDPEREMAEMAENSLTYAVLTEVLARRGAFMRMVLTEGRG